MKQRRHPHRPDKKKANLTSFVIEEKDSLLASLISHLPQKSRKVIKAVLRDRQVLVDRKPVTQFDYGLKPGQRVEVHWEREEKSQHLLNVDIVHEDQDIIVINKPAGLLTIATDKEKRRTAYSMLSSYIKAENPENRIFIIHRIDRETSGLLIFARSEKVKQQIQKTWNSTISRRTYIAVVEGVVNPPVGTITSWLRESKAYIVYSSQRPEQGKRAVTNYRKIKGNNTLSLLQISLETGRKHQIRVHMQDINHPVVGDKKYGATLNPLRRMGLHAQILEFSHPATGKQYRFDTGIPQAFSNLFSSADRHKKADSG